MDFYIFNKKGNYIGMRGVAPTEQDLVGIEATPENIDKMTNFVKPMLSNGEIIETATAEEIAQAESERCKPVLSRMVFFRNVWRVLLLTEDDILAEVEKIEDVNERVEIRNMVRNASEFERQHPDLIRMAKKMGIHEQVLNQIFQ